MAVHDTVDTAPHPQLMGGLHVRLADEWSVHEEARVEVEADHGELMSLLGLCSHVLANDVVHGDDVTEVLEIGPS